MEVTNTYEGQSSYIWRIAFTNPSRIIYLFIANIP